MRKVIFSVWIVFVSSMFGVPVPEGGGQQGRPTEKQISGTYYHKDRKEVHLTDGLLPLDVVEELRGHRDLTGPERFEGLPDSLRGVGPPFNIGGSPVYGSASDCQGSMFGKRRPSWSTNSIGLSVW